MIISVINHTNGRLLDEQVQTAIRAINRQITEDFEPYWSLGALLRLEGRSGPQPTKQALPDMRGDAVLYLWDKSDVPGALGYHNRNNSGIPFGFVFLDIIEKYHESWTVTLSHEAMEAILDPEVNLLVQGPHPAQPNRDVFHWYEACDAVQAETYKIDDIEVSNFVLPLYFTSSDEVGGRNDFLGRAHNGQTLKSFGINPGGYIGFYDPVKGDHDTFSMKGDMIADRRMEFKKLAKEARRAVRHALMRKGSASQAARRTRARAGTAAETSKPRQTKMVVPKQS
jgi:hypothetical protein